MLETQTLRYMQAAFSVEIELARICLDREREVGCFLEYRAGITINKEPSLVLGVSSVMAELRSTRARLLGLKPK